MIVSTNNKERLERLAAVKFVNPVAVWAWFTDVACFRLTEDCSVHPQVEAAGGDTAVEGRPGRPPERGRRRPPEPPAGGAGHAAAHGRVHARRPHHRRAQPPDPGCHGPPRRPVAPGAIT